MFDKFADEEDNVIVLEKDEDKDDDEYEEEEEEEDNDDTENPIPCDPLRTDARAEAVSEDTFGHEYEMVPVLPLLIFAPSKSTRGSEPFNDTIYPSSRDTRTISPSSYSSFIEVNCSVVRPII
jgi:hypothetical protein